MVSMVLDGLPVDDLPAWMLRELSKADLQAFLDRLRLAIAGLALPEE